MPAPHGGLVRLPACARVGVGRRVDVDRRGRVRGDVDRRVVRERQLAEVVDPARERHRAVVGERQHARARRERDAPGLAVETGGQAVVAVGLRRRRRRPAAPARVGRVLAGGARVDRGERRPRTCQRDHRAVPAGSVGRDHRRSRGHRVAVDLGPAAADRQRSVGPDQRRGEGSAQQHGVVVDRDAPRAEDRGGKDRLSVVGGDPLLDAGADHAVDGARGGDAALGDRVLAVADGGAGAGVGRGERSGDPVPEAHAVAERLGPDPGA